MDTKFSLPFISPSAELLKRSARIFHLIAAIFITIIAIYQLAANNGSKLLCWSQVIIAFEIIILVFVPALIYEMPGINLLFRLAEAIIFSGNAILFLREGHILSGTGLCLTAITYFFVFKREKRFYQSENVDITHTGITIPDFTKDAELNWPDVKSIVIEYHSMIIETLRNKTIKINLRKGLGFEEKQALDDFCSSHLLPC